MKSILPKTIKRTDFFKTAEICRLLSSSIISDDNMIQEFNHLNSIERHQIIREIKNIDTSKKVETLSFEWNLRIVEIHIISGKHNIDPAVVLLTGIFKNVERIVLS